MLQMAYLWFYMRPSYLIKDLISRKGFIFKRVILNAVNMVKSVVGSG